MRVFAVVLLLALASCPSSPPKPVAPPQLAASRVAGGAPTLIFLHGWAGDRSYWSRQLETFGGRHEVLTVDMPGHGESTAVLEPWTVLGLADEIVRVLEFRDLDEVILVGHSMGGVVALEVARRTPGRILGVVGVDTLHDADFRWNEDDIRRVATMYETDWEGTMRTFVQSMFTNSEAPEMADYVIERALAGDRGPLLALLKDAGGVDQEPLFRSAGVPIRCINSASAPTPTDVEGNREICDYDARLMEGVGHYPMLEKPAEFDALLAEAIAELTQP